MKSVLIIQTAFIGDAILATALVEQFARSDQEKYKIDCMVRKGNEVLLSNNPHISHVYVWDKKNAKYRDLLRILKEVRTKKYDLVVNLQRYFSTGFVTAFSKAKLKIGYEKNPLSFLFDRKHPHPLGEGSHEVERNMALVREYTGAEHTRPKLYPSEQDFEKVTAYKQQEYITLSPSSVWFTKQWPKEKWIEFLEYVSGKLKVYLLGGPGDIPLLKEIRQKSRHEGVEILAGKLSLLQSAALMQDARMNYVNDSAPLHLCSAMNAPVTAVFCSTVPQFGFTPLSDVSHIVEVKENPVCRPCGFHGKRACPEGHFKCALDIPVSALVKVLT